MGKRWPVLWLLKQLQNPPPWDDPRIFVAAPIRPQVKKLYWNDIKKLVPKAWVETISETELTIVTKWGAELSLVGLDAPDRIEGVSWDGGVIDELASCKAGIFDANIRPALGDRRGWCNFIGVPDLNGPSQAEYRQMCEWGRDPSYPEWEDFCWGSAGILPDSEIESMRLTMDPRIFKQETTGAFIVAGGLAFPDFSRERHVSRVAYDRSLPLRVMLDFNVDPMSVVIGQQTEAGDVQILRAMQLPDTVSRMAANAFVIEANRQGWRLDQVFVYGDPAGKQRSTAADKIDQTSWTMFYNALAENGVRYTRMVRGNSVPIPATVNSVNSLLLNAKGQSRLTINSDRSSGCNVLVTALESALAQTDMEEFHALAAFRYYAEREFPVLSGQTNNRLLIA